MENSADIFSFIMVIISIVIGLGITEILGGTARLLRARKGAKPYWLHTVLIVGVFTTLLSVWWEAWRLQSAIEWSFISLIFLLAGPVGLYLIASLTFPDQVDGHDFREYYYQNSNLIWLIAAITTILSNLFWITFFDGEVIDLDNLPSLIQILIVFTLIISKKPHVHAVGVPMFFLLILADQLVFRFSIG